MPEPTALVIKFGDYERSWVCDGVSIVESEDGLKLTVAGQLAHGNQAV